MNQTRRHLLIVGALTAAASAALPLEAFGKVVSHSAATPPAPTENEYEALSRLTVDDFKPFVGAAFNTKSHDGHSVRVTLAEVQTPPTLASTAPAAPDPHIYALRFKAVSGATLKQDTYVFQNSGLGRFAMFVVPSAAAAKPMYYTGHVNRSV